MAVGLSDQEVQELIRIVEGGVKERRGYWYTLGIPINHHYSLDEQLDAVKKLGNSRAQEALHYLRTLDRCESKTSGDRLVWYYTTHWHPNAKRELGEVLSYFEQWDNTGIVLDNAHPRHGEAERTLNEAISQLEESLRPTS